MSRSLLLVAAAALFASGCLAAFPDDPTGSASPASGSGGGGGTASSGSGGGNGGGGDVAAADMATAAGDLATNAGADLANAPSADMANHCINLSTPVQSGHHNEGQACLSCHNGGGGPTKFTWAGTLYNAAANGATLVGATIEVIDAAGKIDRIVSSSDGNFYSTTTLTPPFTVRASGCPNNSAMVSKATGDCNSSGCHTSAMRVHLP
jgi:hypothetical protein